MEVAHPGFGLYNVKSVLVSSNIKQQSWRAILHVYSKGLWIFFGPSFLLLAIILGLLNTKGPRWQNLLMAILSTLKAIFAQPFNQDIFLKVG